MTELEVGLAPGASLRGDIRGQGKGCRHLGREWTRKEEGVEQESRNQYGFYRAEP